MVLAAPAMMSAFSPQVQHDGQVCLVLDLFPGSTLMLSRCHSCLSTALIHAVCTRHAVLGLASQHLISIDAKGADSVGPSFARGDMVLNWQVDKIVDRHSCFHCHMPCLFHMPVANLTGSSSDQGLRNRNCVPDRLCMLGIDLKVGYVKLCNHKLSATALAHAARGCSVSVLVPSKSASIG